MTILLVALLYLLHSGEADKYLSGNNTDRDAAKKFLEANDVESTMVNRMAVIASWNYDNNLTETNKQKMLEQTKETAKFLKGTWRIATGFDWKQFQKDDPKTYRWFKSLTLLGDAALPEDKHQELNGIIANMSETYSKAKVCGFDNKCLDLEPGLTELLASSNNYDELKLAWTGWRNATGKQVKKSFLRYIQLKNQAAKLNGFDDAGAFWRESYETDGFVDDVENLWNDLKPFYTQLHAYVRRKLITEYPGKIKVDGPIPAHLLGNMWAQTWGNIGKRIEPFPNETETDVTPKMNQQGMTPLQMFKISEEFFTSLGLIKMTPEFWNKSVIEKPKDRDIICHASAWDFLDGKDTRIKMCTRVNMEDLITVHHEMGHIEYYLQYANQPQVFRNGANPGFHEAVGDVLALSVSTPGHLKKIGLLEESSQTESAEINYLLKMALEKIAFLPFAYLVDRYRWNVFNGEISEQELNTKWWEMRFKYQGLCPPTKRTNDDLDAASKYHVIADVPYIRYFVSFVIQFQFHKALCKEAGHEGPLHKCDIYQNTDAGKLLSDVLSKGSSVHWKEAMSIMTKGETDQMEVSGILEYFDPLIKWLELQNKDEDLGWRNQDFTECPE